MKRGFILLCLLLSVSALSLIPAATQDTDAKPLDGVKTYLVGKSTDLADGAKTLADDVNGYYALAKAANFDYAALWKSDAKDVAAALKTAKDQWVLISPIYEQMEGIVAGVPTLSNFDAIIDAGVSAEQDAQNAVDYTITLPDGTMLVKPGNLFGVLEGALWGTRKAFDTAVQADLDGNGTIDFGEVIPDANILKGAADSMMSYTADLLTAADAWKPNETDAFTALVANIPTVSDFFETWKESRFVMGDKATRTDFVVVSRLSDIKDNIASWQAIYSGISPAIAGIDTDRDQQIVSELSSLQTYVEDLYTQEHDGRRFTPEEADVYGAQAQDRAMTITGQIAQAAALLDITLPE